ncbi:dolichyldiphosphatase 1 [Lingula anatina]|uniref:Dolichyldiphosphatase n=1 Tax=Lingula anatina TaxID=7574 RepID=A0A1S3H8D9_LINAN|nr:dolichyldiphosphatase 1 [Lingula anatina]|eukprot:XP_013382252.1 dolichyldiphosphatase 1 [Lingula anatina]
MASASAGASANADLPEFRDDEMVKWKAISLTHVDYPEGDIFGFLLACSSLLPVFILGSFFTLIIFRRDLHTICYFAGLILNESVNWVTKHIIKEPRPRARSVLHTEYGMPSSHSQFMWFFATYLVFFLFIRVHRNNKFVDELWKYATLTFVFSLATAVGYSRIYLGYHTFRQVFWGAVLGAILGALWFSIVQLVCTPFFPLIAAWPISEYLMIRDSTLIPNVMWFEYTSHRTESRSRLRKQGSWKSS